MPYADKEKRNARAREYNKKRIEENREYIRKYKQEHGCALCPENEPAVLDFHHISGEKEMNVSRMVVGGSSRERFEREIAKCILVCANCHRKIHAGIITIAG